MGTKQIRSVQEVFETDVLELVSKDEQIDQHDYGKSIEVVSVPSAISGEVLSVTLYASKSSGAIQDSAGHVLVFDEDPVISAGDTALTIAQRRKLLADIAVSAGDWLTDTSSGHASILLESPVYFGSTDTLKLWAAWYHTDAVSLNDAPTDDEVLEIRGWGHRCDYQRPTG